MTDILDLDKLSPLPKIIKFQGNEYECFPITVKQLVVLARLDQELRDVKDFSTLIPKIKEALISFIPGLKNSDFNFTFEQLQAIMIFAQASSTPQIKEAGGQAAVAHPVKKKENSPKV